MLFQLQCSYLHLQEETESNTDNLISPVRGLAAKQRDVDCWTGRRYFSIRKSSCSSFSSVMAFSFAKEFGEATERLGLTMAVLKRLLNLQSQF